MRCPNCRNKVLQKSGNRTRVRIKGAVTFEGDLCKAQCYWCGGTVTLPLELSKGTQVEREQFILPRP